MDPSADEFLVKARAAIDGAQSEFAAGRFDNVANRCYYACFQAAVAALNSDGVQSSAGPDGRWSHSAVQAQFNGVLLNRRKRFDIGLREVLTDLATLRQKADYSRRPVTRSEAQRAVRQASRFVDAVTARSSS